MPEGLQVTLSSLGDGLTVDKRNKKLLEHSFIFQCPPMEEFKVAHAFTAPDYDTIVAGQFSRSGGQQLKLWSFDTLVMDLGLGNAGDLDAPKVTPGWVPFVKWDQPGVPSPSESYVKTLTDLVEAGAPFRFTAAYADGPVGRLGWQLSTPVLNTNAVLMSFDETRKAGEGDAIYLNSVQFKEWRHATVEQRGLGHHKGHPSDTPPTTVRLMRSGVCITAGKHKRLPPPPPADPVVGGTDFMLVGRRGLEDPLPPAQGLFDPLGGYKCTLITLARYFYHDPSRWRDLARANHLQNIGGNTALIDSAPYKGKVPKGGIVLVIPALHHRHRPEVLDPSPYHTPSSNLHAA